MKVQTQSQQTDYDQQKWSGRKFETNDQHLINITVSGHMEIKKYKFGKLKY